MIPSWDALYAAGADVVLSGHDHEYERFAPQTSSGVADSARGIREFVVGTGGRSHYAFGTIRANSEVRNSETYGECLTCKLPRTPLRRSSQNFPSRHSDEYCFFEWHNRSNPGKGAVQRWPSISGYLTSKSWTKRRHIASSPTCSSTARYPIPKWSTKPTTQTTTRWRCPSQGSASWAERT